MSNKYNTHTFPVLAILPYLSHSQVGLDGNIAIQNYRAIEAAYARELIRPTGIPTPFDSQITFVQQVSGNTLLFLGLIQIRLEKDVLFLSLQPKLVLRHGITIVSNTRLITPSKLVIL